MTKHEVQRLFLKSSTSGLTQLIGRKDEIATIRQYLLETNTRLLTLTGPGGIGKTSLAQQVIVDLQDAFTDGIYFVSLALIRDHELVIPTIAQSLEIKDVGGMGGLAIPELLLSFLQKKQLLLLLDNFEQVLSATSKIAELLLLCPLLKILVTSRAALHIKEEQEFYIPPLAIPNPERLPEWEKLTQYAAVELFLQRAQARKSSFTFTSNNAPPIAEICAYLNGNPMAIKLATTYINVLSPQALLQRLKKDPLGTLTDDSRDVPIRHQNLNNTLTWSYGLLEPGERRLFRRLSVFMGGCTLEALEQISVMLGDEARHMLVGIASLIDKSLVQQDERGKEEYFVILPTIREYSLDRLKEEKEEVKTRMAHAQYYLELAEKAAPKLRSSEQEQWFQHLEQDYENLRTAFDWLLIQEEIELAVRLAGTLWWYWLARGYLSEGQRWLEQALSHSSEEMVAKHAELLNNLGMLTLMRGDIIQTEEFFTRGFAFSQKTSNKEAIAFSLQGQGMVAWVKNNFAEARTFTERAMELWRQIDEKEGIAWSLSTLALLLAHQQEYVNASIYAKESLRLFRVSGDSFGLAYGLLRIAEVAFLQDNAVESGQRSSKKYTKNEDADGKNAEVFPTQKRAGTGKKRGLPARMYLQESLAIFQRLGNRWGIAQAFSTSGRMIAAQGDQNEAYSFYKKALIVALEIHDKESIISFLDIASCLEGLAYVEGSRGYHTLAVQFLGVAEILRKTSGVSLPDDSRILYNDTVAAARHSLGKEAFTDIFEQGRNIKIKQVFDIITTHEYQIEQEIQIKQVVYLDDLTLREIEVLCLLAKGLSDAQVAKALVISPRTVNSHVTRIYRKLNISTRSAATRYVIENHLDCSNSLLGLPAEE